MKQDNTKHYRRTIGSLPPSLEEELDLITTNHPEIEEPIHLDAEAKSQLKQLILKAELKARDSERNRIWAVMRSLGIDYKEIIMVRKEWDESARKRYQGDRK